MRKTWADREGIPSGVTGEVIDGIAICEANRATVFEDRREGIEELRSFMHSNYRAKGVHAVLFGTHCKSGIRYAVYVQDGFLKEVSEE